MAKRTETDDEKTTAPDAAINGAKVTAEDGPVFKATADAADVEAALGKSSKAKSRAKANKDKSKGRPTKADPAPKRQVLQRPYPQKTLKEALVVPQAVKDKNSGNALATELVAKACGYTNLLSANFILLTTSSRDYDLTVGTSYTPKIELATLGRQIVYPGNKEVEKKSKIEAFFKVDLFKKVFDHYGGTKNFPEPDYLHNTLQQEFNLHEDLCEEFVKIFTANCEDLGLQEGLGEGAKVATQDESEAESPGDIKVVGEPKGKFDRTAFVIMPFTERNFIVKRSSGFFHEVLYTLITPAANDAGFAVETAEGQGSDVIQSTIINQLLKADLVIADLTDHNPNVLFELGIRIAKEKPVCLLKASDTDRIFDVDNMMRYIPYSPNLWASSVKADRQRLAEHIKGAWDNRGRYRSYMQILTGSNPVTAK